MRQWIDIILEGSAFSMPISEIFLDARSVRLAMKDVLTQQLSMTPGPVSLFTGTDGLHLGDGYHRVVQAILAGRKAVRASIDPRYATDFASLKHPWTPADGFETLGFTPDQVLAAKRIVAGAVPGKAK